MTEQDILDTLTEHAKRIADSVLSNTEAGQDLEKDVRVGAHCRLSGHMHVVILQLLLVDLPIVLLFSERY